MQDYFEGSFVRLIYATKHETEVEKCGFLEFGIKISLFGHISSNLYKIYPYILTRVLSRDRHE